jgi:pimeloyl-ACP methyl ester carboxylesterase
LAVFINMEIATYQRAVVGAENSPSKRNCSGIWVSKNLLFEGYSMGGAIVMDLLAFHPERLHTAVIGGVGWSPLGQDMRGIRQKVGDSLADSLEQGKGMTSILTLAMTPVGGALPDSKEVEKQNRWFLSRNDPLALAAVLRNYYFLPLTYAAMCARFL